MATLMQASAQWSKRPKDERFTSLGALDAAARSFRTRAVESDGVEMAQLKAQVGGANNDEVILVGDAGVPARLSFWAFGQLSSRIKAPAKFLRQLPVGLAADVVNDRIQALVKSGDPDTEEDKVANVLFDRDQNTLGQNKFMIRAFTSDKYTRIWNSDITSRLLQLSLIHPEWQPAPASYEQIGFGGEKAEASRGLYLSQHDMFAFMVDNGRRIFEKDPNGGLSRGFFAWNSETGSKTFGIMSFLYEYICGNHIVWGASQIKEVKLRHVGNADERAFSELELELKAYSEASAQDDEAKITSAKMKVLGQDKESVLDAIFKIGIPQLSRKLLTEGYDTAEKHEDWYGSPRTVWGMVNGLTQVARDYQYADQRVEVEAAAGKVMKMAF